MKIDHDKINRLIQLSRSQTYDPYTRFSWPKDIPLDCLWCDEDLLTTYGTEIHKNLTEEQLFLLSKWETIHFFSLNVHGIKSVLEFVCRCFYNKRYTQISEYLHIFLAEENSHMWFFARFCHLYGRKLYPTLQIRTPSTSDDIENDLYSFASALIFEEFVDYYNQKVGRNKEVPDIVREINYQHHVDESRHVAFGREIIRKLHSEILSNGADEEQQMRISLYFKKLIIHFTGLMYNPLVYADTGIVETTHFRNSAAFRNFIRNSPDRDIFHHAWFTRTVEFFRKCGIVNDASFFHT
ncbi:diiron oxygenase [Candidatus Spongiihabitans sp.]|uniref:diiron oxygenase n=1 Tax=Candidatus Spongiihabitans sp. TaxID=3101308 RepID=UPI003C6F348C